MWCGNRLHHHAEAAQAPTRGNPGWPSTLPNSRLHQCLQECVENLWEEKGTENVPNIHAEEWAQGCSSKKQRSRRWREEKEGSCYKAKGKTKNTHVKTVKTSKTQTESDIQKKINHLQESLKRVGKDLMVALVGQMTKPGGFKKSVTCLDGKEAGLFFLCFCYC